MNGKRRVVVTGIGALTPIGLTVEDFWKNMMAGTSGAGPITYFDTALYGVGSSRVDLQACKLEYSIVSPK